MDPAAVRGVFAPSALRGVRPASRARSRCLASTPRRAALARHASQCFPASRWRRSHHLLQGSCIRQRGAAVGDCISRFRQLPAACRSEGGVGLVGGAVPLRRWFPMQVHRRLPPLLFPSVWVPHREYVSLQVSSSGQLLGSADCD